MNPAKLWAISTASGKGAGLPAKRFRRGPPSGGSRRCRTSSAARVAEASAACGCLRQRETACKTRGEMGGAGPLQGRRAGCRVRADRGGGGLGGGAADPDGPRETVGDKGRGREAGPRGGGAGRGG